MSKLHAAAPVKPLFSLLASDLEVMVETMHLLSDRCGKPEYISRLELFDYSDYYEKEMGAPLIRRFVFFETLIPPEELPALKLFSNDIEERFCREGKRRVNIDPGYLALSHLILATGKGYSHRPYLRDGVYADLTLIYAHGAFQPLPWTYPDYASPSMLLMLNNIRQRYLVQLGRGRKKHHSENVLSCGKSEGK